MKPKFLSLIHLFLFFVLFSEDNYFGINHYQVNPFNSFVKLKIRSNLNGKPKDTKKPKPPHTSTQEPSNPLENPTSTQKPQSSPHKKPGPIRKPLSWPPPETSKRKTPPPLPGSLSESYAWPPRSRPKPSIAKSVASGTGSNSLDSEDLFTAVKVQVREDDSDEESEPYTAKLVMLSSDSDTDSDSSDPGTPTSKSSGSGSDSDTSVPGTPVTKRSIIIKSEEQLSPELAEKVQRMKVLSEKIVRKKLSSGKVKDLISSPKLSKRVLLISIPLLIELLEAIFMSLTANGRTMLSPLILSQIQLPSQSSSGSLFLTNLELGNQSIKSLKLDMKEKFEEKYKMECNFQFLKAQTQVFLKSYLEHANVDAEIKLVSNPRKGKVDNRIQKLQSLYGQLKPSFHKMKQDIVKFLDCYLTYLDPLIYKGIEPTKKDQCTWSELLVLNFFLTAFKGFSMLFRESLVDFEQKMPLFDKLYAKPKKDLTEDEKKTLKQLKPDMMKISQLRLDYELCSLLSSLLVTIIGKCLNFLNSEN
ncbi:hypothetical protein CmeUKMEL1_02960 [Cryptosporidium meleagridis]|uniref:Integral membrane protein n=1 Tax=Cryptosporidium meleagridis TaxID=93969 RepID=A0A2P4YXL6_9CRYT|nr:hypothetical protein CmeUKMEL1_02960 [Cryptosporidium meleagridis]